MQGITPCLWFDGQAQQAAEFYVSVFPDSKIIEANPVVVQFSLRGHSFVALNGGPEFKPTMATSFQISCESQEEVDYFWQALSGDGGQESQCGWLTDKYGFAWQVIPTEMFNYINGPDAQGAQRAMQAMLQMGKLEIEPMKQAYLG